LIAAAAVTWFLAVANAQGQTFGAALLAALAAGAVGQVLASGSRCVLTPVVPAVAILVLAVLGPLAAKMHAGNHLIESIYRGDFLGLGRPISLDWAAGALLGAPIGLSWAGAIIDQRAAEAA
jgi:hypothetical protein